MVTKRLAAVGTALLSLSSGLMPSAIACSTNPCSGENVSPPPIEALFGNEAKDSKGGGRSTSLQALDLQRDARHCFVTVENTSVNASSIVLAQRSAGEADADPRVRECTNACWNRKDACEKAGQRNCYDTYEACEMACYRRK